MAGSRTRRAVANASMVLLILSAFHEYVARWHAAAFAVCVAVCKHKHAISAISNAMQPLDMIEHKLLTHGWRAALDHL